MNTSSDKVTDLKSAVEKYVTHGCHISIGGVSFNRKPMAPGDENIPQGIKRLHPYAPSNGQGVDELVGAGSVQRIEIAYAGNGRFAPTCIRFRKAVEKGDIDVEDYSNYQMTLRFLAGAMGVPFLPTKSALGSSILEKWGFSEKMRREESRIPDKKCVVMDNPFNGWQDSPKVVLVPAINPDVTIIHVQKADAQGTVRINGLPFADVEQVKAARHVIVTCEELVENGELRENPDSNQIPFFVVDAVVPVPFGAYPTACYRYYDYDPVYLNDYRRVASKEELYGEYLETRIMGMKSHQDLMDHIGTERLDRIRADAETGYATGLDRR
jgi:glutaconate CoA-transferase, subunit A